MGKRASPDKPDRMNNIEIEKKLTAEFLGTAFLLAGIVGSGIMGENLSGGIVGIALLANSIATGAILAVLILIFGPLSGAHFNPAVTVSFFLQHKIGGRLATYYILVQVLGAFSGTVVAHIMFGEPLLTPSSTVRTGIDQWLGEFVATFGLIATIIGCTHTRPRAIAYAVGLYIVAGYWFTSSTSFANPAVTLARAYTNTFSGINPDHMPIFVLSQFIAAIVVTLLFRWLYKSYINYQG